MSEETIYAGTIGQGVWRSRDGGETFSTAYRGMFLEAEIRALAVHLKKPNVLYAGTDAGLFRTENSGDDWSRLETPFDAGQGWQAGILIWSLLVSPENPDTLYVGTCPPAVYRSQDGGTTWQKLDIPLTAECGPIRYSRVTCLAADPDNVGVIWAGVEIDGLWRSNDGGETWRETSSGISSRDLHAFSILPASETAPRLLLATTNNDLNLSLDDGETWQPQSVGNVFPHRYCRGLLTLPDNPDLILVGNGSGPPGTSGSLHVSRDRGQAWQTAALPAEPNSTVWTFAASPANPNRLYAATVLGQLYRTDDLAQTWRKCRHEFGEIRALAVTRE